jgi:hypothetical protein
MTSCRRHPLRQNRPIARLRPIARPGGFPSPTPRANRKPAAFPALTARQIRKPAAFPALTARQIQNPATFPALTSRQIRKPAALSAFTPRQARKPAAFSDFTSHQVRTPAVFSSLKDPFAQKPAATSFLAGRFPRIPPQAVRMAIHLPNGSRKWTNLPRGSRNAMSASLAGMQRSASVPTAAPQTEPGHHAAITEGSPWSDREKPRRPLLRLISATASPPPRPRLDSPDIHTRGAKDPCQSTISDESSRSGFSGYHLPRPYEHHCSRRIPCQIPIHTKDVRQ